MSSSKFTVPEVIFISIKPIVKMMVISFGGGILARIGILSPEVCKANATMIMTMLLPLLIFSTVVRSFDPGNLSAVLVLVLSGIMYAVMGLTFGLIVRWSTPVPPTWRGGIVAAGLLGNWGDLVLGYTSTLSKNQPFKPSDVELGTAYSSIFMIWQLVVIYNFGGLQLIKRDFDQRPRADVEMSSDHSLKVTTEDAAKERPIDLRAGNPQADLQSPPDKPFHAEIAIIEADSAPTPVLTTTFNDTQQGGDRSVAIRGKTTLSQRAWLAFKRLINPPFISLVVSLIIANVPALKALFVHTPSFSVADAPDQMPPLDFIMEITGFAGPFVPVLGLIILGATFSRMSIKNLPRGFWKSQVLLAILKLVVGPIIGMVWTTQLAKHTPWIPTDDKILRFVMIMTSGTPSAMVQIYLTTMFAPPNHQDSVELSALSAILLVQYAMLMISLTAVVSYSLFYIL